MRSPPRNTAYGLRWGKNLVAYQNVSRPGVADQCK